MAGMRRRTVVVWLVLAALVTGITAIELAQRSRSVEGDTEHIAGTPDSRMLMPAPMEELAAIELAVGGTLHRFERDAAGVWFYHGVHAQSQAAHGHQADPATAQLIEKAFGGLGRARKERQFKLDLQAGSYGLNTPQMIILVYAKNNPQPLAQYAVGDIAPDGFSRYVLPVGGAMVVTVANYQIDNLRSLIDAVAGKSAQSPANNLRP